jgi:hypothetical protein
VSPLGRPCQLGKTEKRQTMILTMFRHYMVNHLLVTVKDSGGLCMAEQDSARAELATCKGSCLTCSGQHAQVHPRYESPYHTPEHLCRLKPQGSWRISPRFQPLCPYHQPLRWGAKPWDQVVSKEGQGRCPCGNWLAPIPGAEVYTP